MNGFDAADTLRQTQDPTVPPFPLNPRTSLGNQLEQVAKLISLRESLGMNRQLFFCSLGGFDTHFNQVNNGQPNDRNTGKSVDANRRCNESVL